MFHHVFVKNYLANSPDAARFRTVLKERVSVLGKGVLTNMCAFILENGELFEKSGDALFGLIQLIDEVDKEVAISGEKSRQNMNKVLEDILAKYPAMQTSWDSRITKQASDMVEAAIKNQLNEDTFCENVQTLRTSTNLVDGYVFSAFLKKLLAVFSSYLAGTKTDTSVVLKCSDIIGILVKHRLLQEREQEFLASLVSVVASAPYAALAIVLPALHNQIGGVLQDYPTLSKDFYSNATVRAVLAKYSTLSTPVIQPSLSDSYLSSSLRGAKSVGAYSEVGGITPSLSHFTINVSYDDALSPLLADCPPLSETQCAAVKRLLNRMGGNNVDTVSEKLFSLFTPTQIPSFVQFFVQDYVCFQSIHMETYLNLVLMRNDESFVSLVLDASILSALRLLKDDSESTRNSLRAVGSFIGSITLARNRVLPLRKLNLSALVEKSREEGAVHNTIVLVTSILLQADNSIVFRSVRQPWLRSVLRVLCVLHEDPNIPVTEKKQYVPWLLSKLNVSDEECEELKAEALNSLHARVTPALYSTLSTPLPSERVFPSPQLQRSLPSSSTPRMPAYYPQSPMPPTKDDFISFLYQQLPEIQLKPEYHPYLLRLNEVLPRYIQEYTALLSQLPLNDPYAPQGARLDLFLQQARDQLNSDMLDVTAANPHIVVFYTELVETALQYIKSFVHIQYLNAYKIRASGAPSTLRTMNSYYAVDAMKSKNEAFYSTVMLFNSNLSAKLSQGATKEEVDYVRGELLKQLSLACGTMASEGTKDVRYVAAIDFVRAALGELEKKRSALLPQVTVTVMKYVEQQVGVSCVTMLSTALHTLLRVPTFKMNMSFLIQCLNDNAISVAQVDSMMASLITAFRNDTAPTALIPVLCDFIQQLLITRRVVFANQLPQTIPLIAEWLSTVASPALQPLQSILLHLQHNYVVLVQETANQSSLAAVYDVWMSLFSSHNGAPKEEDVTAFILAIKKKGLLASEAQTVIMFRLLFTSLLNEIETTITPSSTSSIQAFVFLLHALVRYTDLKSKATVLLCIVTAVSNILVEEQKLGKKRAVYPAWCVFASLIDNLLAPLLPRVVCQVSETDSILAIDYTRILLYGLQLTQPLVVPSFMFYWFSLYSSATLLRLCSVLRDNVIPSLFRTILFGITHFITTFHFQCKQNPAFTTLFNSLTSLFLSLKEYWPALLCANYGELCTCVPMQFVQLHNIIASAQPPGTKTLPFDHMTEEVEKALSRRTQYVWNVTEILKKFNLEEKCKQYRETPSLTFCNEMCDIAKSLNPMSVHYCALLYEVLAATCIRSQNAKEKPTLPSSFYQTLLKTSFPPISHDAAISLLDHVRFPCTDTYYFSMLLQLLVQKCDMECVFVAICDRLLVPGPKSWGLQFLFSTLVRSDPKKIKEMSYMSKPEVKELVERYEGKK